MGLASVDPAGPKAPGFVLLFAVAALFLVSCEFEPGLQTDGDYDVVITLYGIHADFASVHTYLMPDSVVHFEGPGQPGGPLSRDYDDLILERVEYNLQAAGYRKETAPEANDPDIIVMVSAASSEWQAANYPWPPRWGWWRQWPGAEEDWYFQSSYYSRGRVYSFSAGTLFIDMGDVRDPGEGDDIMNGIWTAAMNGALSDESPGRAQRLVDFIDRAFSQSPYLGAGE